MAAYLDEIARDRLPVEEIGFTGGEPFLNRDLPAMLRDALRPRPPRAGADQRHEADAQPRRARCWRCASEFGDRLTLRVSLDHHDADLHDLERQEGSFAGAGRPGVAGARGFPRPRRRPPRLRAARTRRRCATGFARLFAARGIPIDAADPVALMLFPEMDAGRDVPEITEACWGILGKSPDSVMCASTRMVVKRRGADAAGGARLHPAALRSAIRAGRDARRGVAAGAAEPPALRQVLRARRRRLLALTPPGATEAPGSRRLAAGVLRRKEHSCPVDPTSVARGALAGAVAGVFASYAMNRFQGLVSSLGDGSGGGGGEPSTVKAAERVVGRRVAPTARRRRAGNAVHYGFGTVLGATYGAAAEVEPG